MSRTFSPRSVPRRKSATRRTHRADARSARRLILESLEDRRLLAGLVNFSPSPTSLSVISGIKFHDVNGDGAYQVGEPGLGGWAIQLLDDATGVVVEQTQTAPNGAYEFTGIPDGSYRVREVMQPGWTQTTNQPPVIVLDDDLVTSLQVSELAFGNFPTTTDYGDAPDVFQLGGYPTLLAQNGARHTVSSLYLGTGVDADVNGQPTPAADGDDDDPMGDDENGVVFLTPLVPGTTARIAVTASQPGRLDAWADFNRDGDWADAFEKIFNNVSVAAGLNQLSFAVPYPFSDFGETFLRFRVSTAGGLGPGGAAADGEVEDYVQEIMAADFGDAPDVSSNPADYPTLRASNGAAHAIPGDNVLGVWVPGVAPTLWLGGLSDQPDPDEDGQPNNLNLGGDDADLLLGDDEDGVTFVSAFPSATGLIPGLVNGVDVTVTVPGGGTGLFNMWLDLNGDGDWADAGEQIFDDTPLADALGLGATYNLTFMLSANATPGTTHARFRFSTQEELSYNGLAWDGEVEDHVVTIDKPLDFGDAPDNSLIPDDYPTTLAKDGARHVVVPGVYLGRKVDPDPDGQPTPVALGDDDDLLAPSLGDDEDGVRLLTPLVPGTTAIVEVQASVSGFVSAWVDFTRDQNWDDPGEKVLASIPVFAGYNQLTFTTPSGAALGTTFARFRFTTQNTVLTDKGLAADGEVEDYHYVIAAADFGDAPDPTYPTLIAQNGAGHAATGALILGGARDVEPDGLSDNNALGDDLSSSDDEDGVTFLLTQSPLGLLPGTTDQLSVVVTGAPGAGAYLDAWIDFNRDGDWNDAGERIVTSDPVIAGPNVGNGVNVILFGVPAGASAGATFARFRLSSQGGLAATGMAHDGEVEDVKIVIDTPRDWGDAPESNLDPLDYPTTLARNGARHIIVPGVYLGTTVDPELDGQPSLDADADDNNGATPDDEDGVVFLTPLIPGATATVQVTASRPGYLNAWVDFDVNERWDTTGEQIFVNQPLVAGVNTLQFTVPVGITPPLAQLPLETVSRFRYTTYVPAPGFSFTGEATDGEVEDHAVSLYKGDWGDAPDPTYPTLAVSNGAVHAVIPVTTPTPLPSTLFLGTAIDGELNGQPTATASGDDNALFDDDDGVSFLTQIMPGTTASISVTVSGIVANASLDAWIDFNGDGDWLDAGEHVIDSDGVTSNVSLGANLLSIVVPTTARVGDTFARFRLSSAGNLSPVGSAADGEVEDYQVTVVTPLDYGDAPSIYSAFDARHTMGAGGPILGSRVDADLTQQTSPNSLGDDLDLDGDDEDGVRLLTPLIQGATARIEVTASSAGRLNAWIDFNADGDWADPGEKIASDLAVTAGANVINVSVPFSPLDPLFPLLNVVGRFRISTATGLTVSGLAADGEVEDHAFTVYQGDYGDAPQGMPEGNYPTTQTANGAGHAINVQGTPFIVLGTVIDPDSDGQPDNAALGDDLDTIVPPDDEDGIVFTSLLQPGSAATVRVSVTDFTVPPPLVPTPYMLNAWLDFNGDGDWNDAGEQIFTNQAVYAGANNLSFSVPADALPTTGVGGRGSPTFSRWRLSAEPNLTTTGLAFTGEVEDHAVDIQTPLDWGDAPDSPLFATRHYGTLAANDGARHPIRPGFSLGETVDPELDGQPDIAAYGDDNSPTGTDDEDGVIFTTALIPGNTASATVLASIPVGLTGKLDAWIDFNGDGDFADPPEHIAANLTLVDGANTITFTVPNDAPAIATISRFRLSSVGNLGPTGLALDGEVEDHLAIIGPNVDFGDAPATSYPTTLLVNGARHLIVNNVHLGAPISGNDADPDGQPNTAALGDDADGNDDEDGIVFVTPLIGGFQATIQVTVQNVGKLSGWIDLNRDGDWADAGEKVLSDITLNPSLNPTTLNFILPASLTAGSSYARFRYSTVSGLSYDGPAPDGEVEDYQVTLQADPNLASLSINDVTVQEGNSGTTNAVLTVTLGPTASPVTVQYATADNTATVADNDYQSTSGTLSFPVSATTQTRTISVPIIGDTLTESNETFFVNLFNAVGASVADGQGQVTILNDEQAVVAYTLVVKDALGATLPLTTGGRYQVSPGQQIMVEVSADDQRAFGANGGVFAGYADLTYSPNLADYMPNSLTIAAGFPNSRAGLIDEPNSAIDEAGGATGFAPPGSDPAQLLFTVGLTVSASASQGSVITLALNPADLATHNTLVWGQIGAVSASYASLELEIPADVRIWQNPRDRYDVNNDGLVTNEDLQLLLEELRRPGGGPRQLTSPPEPLPPPPSSNYWDVNGDGFLSVLDAGDERDELNRRAGSPLTAAPALFADASTSLDGDEAHCPSKHVDNSLTVLDAMPVLQETIAQYAAAGLPDSLVQQLTQVEIRIADLAGDLLAATYGNVITLDVNAAGRGWHVATAEATTALSNSVPNAVSSSLGDSQASSTDACLADAEFDGMDLLSVLAHELGHVLGADHDEAVDTIMSETLAAGVRRSPTAEAVDRILASL